MLKKLKEYRLTVTLVPWSRESEAWSDGTCLSEVVKASSEHLARRSLVMKYLRLGYQVKSIEGESLMA